MSYPKSVSTASLPFAWVAITELIVLAPFSDFESVLRDYNRTGQGLRRADWVPLVDVRESESAYLIDVEVPAVASEDLTVSVAENMLTVTGKSQIAENDHAESYYRSERRRGSFSRSFRLPRDADAELISAETKDGLIMGVQHIKYDVHGVQFHPESIKTKLGIKILKNFIRI